MTAKQEKRAAFIRDAVARSMIPRNQIANISGLTNTYIRDLEQGNIANVSRDKLLKFSTAVGLDLTALDHMLTIFDCAKLNPDDIPVFIENAKKQKPSNSVHPARDFFGYELLLLATESLSGPKTISTNHPSVILQPDELRFAFLERSPRAPSHPIHDELRRAIGRERRRNLISQLGRYEMHHYISKRALEHYLLSVKTPRERQLRAEHLSNIREFVNTYPRFRYHLTDIETGFNCLLKHSEAQGESERVFFYTHDMSLLQGQVNGQIIGFYTGNPVIIDQFKKDVGIVEKRILDPYRDPADLTRYLTSLIDQAGPA